jgi:hypothetical protein
MWISSTIGPLIFDLQTSVVSDVTKEVYVTTIMRVEVECESLTLTLTLNFFHFVYLEFGKGGV